MSGSRSQVMNTGARPPNRGHRAPGPRRRSGVAVEPFLSARPVHTSRPSTFRACGGVVHLSVDREDQPDEPPIGRTRRQLHRHRLTTCEKSLL